MAEYYTKEQKEQALAEVDKIACHLKNRGWTRGWYRYHRKGVPNLEGAACVLGAFVAGRGREPGVMALVPDAVALEELREVPALAHAFRAVLGGYTYAQTIQRVMTYNDIEARSREDVIKKLREVREVLEKL